MKYKLTYVLIISLIILNNCANVDKNLYLKENKKNEYAYMNSKGEIVIPYGKYSMCFTDTIRYFGVVTDNEKRLLGINNKGEILYEVFNYENGPDYLSDGMFRIIKDGKIGYANTKGEIVIDAIYKCAYPFENSKAKVSFKCFDVKMEEHTIWESEDWFFIDKKGNIVEE